ncbi:hypothetical protein RFI_19170 [Reticulomyxa filosa]|uniref:Uncharacterized protein n=1 Tax=Reticulomyxa filosa TaxID=46433 RepID=X6MXA8_RETFI|nr:hypothetical protein RFI_19170 [Reticulomyxa filosa]|eukprot:ETO18117.1 hypothetical protein RFI_19170 [Reticulomyxa filosa]
MTEQTKRKRGRPIDIEIPPDIENDRVSVKPANVMSRKILLQQKQQTVPNNSLDAFHPSKKCKLEPQQLENNQDLSNTSIKKESISYINPMQLPFYLRFDETELQKIKAADVLGIHKSQLDSVGRRKFSDKVACDTMTQMFNEKNAISSGSCSLKLLVKGNTTYDQIMRGIAKTLDSPMIYEHTIRLVVEDKVINRIEMLRDKFMSQIEDWIKHDIPLEKRVLDGALFVEQVGG